MPARAAAFRLDVPGTTISSSSAGTPAFAKWAAIRDPMVPAPSTATRWIGFTRRVYLERNPPRSCRDQRHAVEPWRPKRRARSRAALCTEELANLGHRHFIAVQHAADLRF